MQINAHHYPRTNAGSQNTSNVVSEQGYSDDQNFQRYINTLHSTKNNWDRYSEVLTNDHQFSSSDLKQLFMMQKDEKQQSQYLMASQYSNQTSNSAISIVDQQETVGAPQKQHYPAKHQKPLHSTRL